MLKLRIQYNGTDFGHVYLADVGRRYGLGGGCSIYEYGQDQYIKHGDTLDLVYTSQVMLSQDRGIVKSFVTKGAFAVSVVNV